MPWSQITFFNFPPLPIFVPVLMLSPLLLVVIEHVLHCPVYSQNSFPNCLVNSYIDVDL